MYWTLWSFGHAASTASLWVSTHPPFPLLTSFLHSPNTKFWRSWHHHSTPAMGMWLRLHEKKIPSSWPQWFIWGWAYDLGADGSQFQLASGLSSEWSSIFPWDVNLKDAGLELQVSHLLPHRTGNEATKEGRMKRWWLNWFWWHHFSPWIEAISS